MFDTLTNEGVLVSDADRSEFVLAAGALDGSIFRMLRQGQRVNFDLDADAPHDDPAEHAHASTLPRLGRLLLLPRAVRRVRLLPEVVERRGLDAVEAQAEHVGQGVEPVGSGGERAAGRPAPVDATQP